MAMRMLLSLAICLASFKSYAHQTVDGGDAPPELTILKHEVASERTFTSETKGTQSVHGEPMTQIRVKLVPVMFAKVRNNTNKTILGLTWYFILKKDSNVEYFRIRFSSNTEIKGAKTKTLKGVIARWPRTPRSVSVDELKTEVPVPPQERIVISCLLFSDGSFSSLKDWPKEDCHRLVTAERTKGSSAPPPANKRLRLTAR